MAQKERTQVLMPCSLVKGRANNGGSTTGMFRPTERPERTEQPKQPVPFSIVALGPPACELHAFEPPATEPPEQLAIDATGSFERLANWPSEQPAAARHCCGLSLGSFLLSYSFWMPIACLTARSLHPNSVWSLRWHALNRLYDRWRR